MKPYLYYIGPINTQKIAHRIGKALIISAASRKMLGIAQALRLSGINAAIVTTPMVGKEVPLTSYPAALLLEKKIPVYQLKSISSPVSNRFQAAFNYLFFVTNKCRSRDTVLFYNFFPEYIPAAIYLFITGNRAFLDIEDFPRIELNIREFIGYLSYNILRILCHPSIVVASNGILQKASTAGCVVHGVITQKEEQFIPRPATAAGLFILYGGSLCTDTGTTLFREAIRLLRQEYPQDLPMITFVVTGFGTITDIQDLADDNEHSSIKVSLLTELSPQEYQQQLARCHAGLSLKLPDSNLGQTTFPSKVVEITANSLVLISTRVSDVAQVYEGAARLLDQATPAALCEQIIAFALDHENLNLLAQKGHQRTRDRYAAAMVGQQLHSFLQTARKVT